MSPIVTQHITSLAGQFCTGHLCMCTAPVTCHSAICQRACSNSVAVVQACIRPLRLCSAVHAACSDPPITSAVLLVVQLRFAVRICSW